MLSEAYRPVALPESNEVEQIGENDAVRKQIKRGLELSELNTKNIYSYQFDVAIIEQAKTLAQVLQDINAYAIVSTNDKRPGAKELTRHIFELIKKNEEILRGTTLKPEKQADTVYDYWRAIEHSNVLISRVIGGDLAVAAQPVLNDKKNEMLEIFAGLNDAYQNIGKHMLHKGDEKFSDKTKTSVIWLPDWGYLSTTLVSMAAFGLSLYGKHLQHTHPKDIVKSAITINSAGETSSKATVDIEGTKIECVVDRTESGAVYYTVSNSPAKLSKFDDVPDRPGIIEYKAVENINNGDKFKRIIDVTGEKHFKIDEVLHINKTKKPELVKVESKFATKQPTGVGAINIPGQFRSYILTKADKETKMMTYSKNGYQDHRSLITVAEVITLLATGLAAYLSISEGKKSQRGGKKIETSFDFLEAELRKREDSLQKHLPGRV